MSAPTPPWRPPHPVDPHAVRRPVGPGRSAAVAAVDVVARVGTAVTLAALLVLTGTVLGAVEATPVPAGSTGR